MKAGSDRYGKQLGSKLSILASPKPARINLEPPFAAEIVPFHTDIGLWNGIMICVFE
jgi:hypothetical protein